MLPPPHLCVTPLLSDDEHGTVLRAAGACRASGCSLLLTFCAAACCPVAAPDGWGPERCILAIEVEFPRAAVPSFSPPASAATDVLLNGCCSVSLGCTQHKGTECNTQRPTEETHDQRQKGRTSSAKTRCDRRRVGREVSRQRGASVIITTTTQQSTVCSSSFCLFLLPPLLLMIPLCSRQPSAWSA